MNNLDAHTILVNAERYLWSFVPATHFVTEHPELAAAIQDLQHAQRQITCAWKLSLAEAAIAMDNENSMCALRDLGYKA